MTNEIEDAGIKPEDVLYINSHGTGTHHNDLFETRAIKLAFGDHARNLKVNSTKSMVGHLLGAAGALEFVTCVKELQEGYLHQTLGYEEPDDGRIPVCAQQFTGIRRTQCVSCDRTVYRR